MATGLLTVATAVLCERVDAEGIPEPSMIFYGVIRNSAVNNERVTGGSLTWYIRNEASGKTNVYTVPVTNVLDQFSYVLEVPCEQVLSGTAGSNVLSLTASAVWFDRSAVLYGASPASLVQSAQSRVAFTARDRGRVERVDLLVNAPCDDIDQNGLCDQWEQDHFGYVGVDPAADFDKDGMSNLAEFRAGTDPTDPKSVFLITGYQRNGTGGMTVSWASADGRRYSVLRYPSLLTSNYTIVASQVLATPPKNAFNDTNAPPSGAVFYRILLEP